jgi:ATP-dependent Clp protease ATP-binding subunit ClpA
VDIKSFRGVLTDFINEHTPRLSPHSDADTQPTQIQRVVQRAILHVQSSGKKEVTGANVLGRRVRRKGIACRLLPSTRRVRSSTRRRQLHRAGITKRRRGPGEEGNRRREDAEGEQQPAGALDAYTVDLNHLARDLA